MKIPAWLCLVIIAAAFLVTGYIDMNDEIITHGAVMLAQEQP